MSETVYQAAPETLTVREFKAGGKIMVTTLCCPKTACKTDLKGLYKQRWTVELDIRGIKETMRINILSGKTPDMILKEIWVYLLADNLTRLLMVQAAFITDTCQGKSASSIACNCGCCGDKRQTHRIMSRYTHSV